MTVVPAHAGPAGEQDVWSELCEQETIKAVCIAGSGTQETFKIEESRRPTLIVQFATIPAAQPL